MNTINSATGIPILVLCAVPIFVILFLAILSSIQQMGLFKRTGAVVMAVCVTLLCMIGLYQTFVQPAGTEAAAPNSPPRSLDFLLLPYAAMALAMLSVLLFLFVQRLIGRRESTRQHTDLAKHRRPARVPGESPGREGADSRRRRLPGPHKGKPPSRSKYSEDRNRIRTDQQNKEILK